MREGITHLNRAESPEEIGRIREGSGKDLVATRRRRRDGASRKGGKT